MFNRGSHDLYLLDRRTDTIAEIGVFDDINDAQAVVAGWPRHGAATDDRVYLDVLRERAARASIPIDRDLDHDLMLAEHAITVAAEHDFTVRFNAGRHQPIRFRFERPGVGTHFGRFFTVSGPYVEPSSRADIDAALTDFLDNWSPDKWELDPGWVEAEADYVADGLEQMYRDQERENDWGEVDSYMDMRGSRRRRRREAGGPHRRPSIGHVARPANPRPLAGAAPAGPWPHTAGRHRRRRHRSRAQPCRRPHRDAGTSPTSHRARWTMTPPS